MTAMNPTNRSNDNHFSSFAVGVSLGVVSALMLGTEEGRKILKEILDAIPEKYKKVPEAFAPSKIDFTNVPPTPIIEPEETPHHTTFEFHDPVIAGEAPPPPPPIIHPQHPLKDIL